MRLRIRNLAKKYADIVAVDDLSLEIAPGEVFGFLGPNGAGKTTTLRAVVGLLDPDSGTVEVDGVDRLTKPREAKRRMGYVPDRPYLPPRLTGREFLEYLAGLYDVSPDAARPRILKHLQRFTLTPAADRLVETYSHGMKQKLALGALFIHDPVLLVVDEPMVGLDASAQALVKKILREEAERGKGIFLTTHTLSVAESLCDRIAIVHRGRIVAEGKPSEVTAEFGRPGNQLEEVFLALTSEEEETPGSKT